MEGRRKEQKRSSTDLEQKYEEESEIRMEKENIRYEDLEEEDVQILNEMCADLINSKERFDK